MPFASIKGQARQIEMLTHALTRGTVAHAYLFTGIPGIGKRTTAVAMAQALNCAPGNGDACGHCSSCRKIEHRTHPDLLTIEPEGEYIKINQIRQMQEQIAYKPYQGNYKVVIITHAEKMNLSSANCLLKTLEEPPPHTVLIVVTATPDQLPPTVRSRCQRVMFQPLAPAALVELLSEYHSGTPGELELIALLAGGSFGRALQWMKRDFLKERQKLLTTIAHLHCHSLTALLDLAETLSEERETLEDYLDLLRLWLRDLAVWKETGTPALLINSDLSNEVCQSAGSAGWPDLFEKMEMVDEVAQALRFNVNPRLAMEVMLLRLRLGTSLGVGVT